jgi:hypothetical protein
MTFEFGRFSRSTHDTAAANISSLALVSDVILHLIAHAITVYVFIVGYIAAIKNSIVMLEGGQQQ